MKTNKKVWLFLLGVMLWVISLVVIIINFGDIKFIYFILPKYLKTQVVQSSFDLSSGPIKLLCRANSTAEKYPLLKENNFYKRPKGLIHNEGNIVLAEDIIINCNNFELHINDRNFRLETKELYNFFEGKVNYTAWGVGNDKDFYVYGKIAKLNGNLQTDDLELLTNYENNELWQRFVWPRWIYGGFIGLFIIGDFSLLLSLLKYKKIL